MTLPFDCASTLDVQATLVHIQKLGCVAGVMRGGVLAQVIFMTGWAPAPNQQRAMERGSATVTLEDLQAELARRKEKKA